MEQRNATLKVGDTIKCHDKDDCVDYMTELAKCGIETDFLYEKDGENGLQGIFTKQEICFRK